MKAVLIIDGKKYTCDITSYEVILDEKDADTNVLINIDTKEGIQRIIPKGAVQSEPNVTGLSEKEEQEERKEEEEYVEGVAKPSEHGILNIGDDGVVPSGEIPAKPLVEVLNEPKILEQYRKQFGVRVVDADVSDVVTVKDSTDISVKTPMSSSKIVDTALKKLINKEKQFAKKSYLQIVGEPTVAFIEDEDSGETVLHIWETVKAVEKTEDRDEE